MKEIKLTQGKVALVDDKWFEMLNYVKWHYHNGYAVRTEWDKDSGERTKTRMHRLILDINEPKVYVDHVSGNKSNNQESNIRRCSHAQNVRNQGVRVNNSSGFKGAYWSKQNIKWYSQICINNKCYCLGHFNTKEEAATAYNKAALELHGKFARLNVINKENS